MKKINIIKSNDEYNRIIKSFKPYKYNDFIIYVEKTNQNIYKFGFSVGKKVGNAVTRNKIKRRLKSILDKLDFKKGFNCIIIVKKGIVDKSFQEIENDLNIIINKIDIKKENENEENK